MEIVFKILGAGGIGAGVLIGALSLCYLAIHAVALFSKDPELRASAHSLLARHPFARRIEDGDDEDQDAEDSASLPGPRQLPPRGRGGRRRKRRR